MNGLLRLIVNENKKLAKQTGLRVLLIVIALLTVLLPIPVALFSKVSDSGSRLRNDTSVSEGIERARSHGDALEESYWRRFEKANSFFSNDIDADDISWKADVFYDEYVTMLGWLYASRQCKAVNLRMRISKIPPLAKFFTTATVLISAKRTSMSLPTSSCRR